MSRPLVLGLTGSIGMGKSTVAAMFAEAGVPVFDADAAVHRLQRGDAALIASVEAAFPGTTGPDGVDRARLGARVLGNPVLLGQLEAIVHPAVASERTAFLTVHGDAPLVVMDIPLLFETRGQEMVDKVAVVSAPTAVQRDRVLARPGMTEDRFAAILARQLPDIEKRRRADFVIDTGTTHAATRAQVATLIACLSAKKVR